MSTSPPIIVNYSLSSTHVFALREGAVITVSLEVAHEVFIKLKPGQIVTLNIEADSAPISCSIQDVESVVHDKNDSVLVRASLAWRHLE